MEQSKTKPRIGGEDANCTLKDIRRLFDASISSYHQQLWRPGAGRCPTYDNPDHRIRAGYGSRPTHAIAADSNC